MRNPFLLRASEQNISDEEFARYFAPGVLDLLPGSAEHWNKPLLIQSSPGAGKTSLFRLLTPAVLRHIIGMNRGERSELYSRLRELKVVGDDRALLLGASLACRASFARVNRLSASPTKRERAFIALFNSRVVLATLRAAAGYAQLRFPAGLSALKFKSAERLAPEHHEELTGAELFEWASNIEGQLFRAFDSFSASEFPGQEEFSAFPWLAHLRIQGGERTFPERRLLMIDDVHDLSRDQRRLLIDEALKRRHVQGIWFAERLQALEPAELLDSPELLQEGISVGRDYDGRVRIERAWAARSATFERFVSGIADRRVAQADDVMASAFAPFLESSIDFTDNELGRLSQVLTEMSESVLSSASTRAFYAPLISAIRANEKASLYEQALDWRSFKIIIERDAKRRQGVLQLFKTTQRDSDDLKGSVRAAASLFLARECKLPYYFGFQRAAEIASWNVEQFLRIGAVFFEEISAARVLGDTMQLKPHQQERLLRQAAARYWEELPISVPHGSAAQALIEGFARYAESITYQQNAPYAPGITGFGITQQQRGEISSEYGRLKYEKLRNILAACVANNVLEARDDLRAKGQTWYVVFLNRLLCVKFGLPLTYGGWNPIGPDQLVRWSNGDYRGDSRIEIVLEED